MSTTTIARTTCKYPGCGQPAAPAGGTGRPPEYCAGRGQTRVSAWRERRRLAAEQAGTTISPAEDGSPLTTAKMTGAELLRSLRAEADRITALGAGLRDRIDTLTDPTAAELCGLLSELGYEINDTATDAEHVGGSRVIFAGDLVDRGPASPAVLRLVMGMVPSGQAAEERDGIRVRHNIGCRPRLSGV